MSDGKNETCVEPCINDYILRQDPQVSPLGCYVFNNNSSIDTFNGLATLNNPSTSPELPNSNSNGCHHRNIELIE
ncbi:hypothetical protein RhiirA5_413880 [Rhizophagus irregularis]|uniref:Uncharacterized protein n=1 Tax=Rhizophagus irregularis TaxID=588596 RepID=A0A2N0PVC7_9GLOM|nr:hypothetical protein RhiirA5_413880 [Rhizophagus irregularis]PKC67963.1 hypothetical protein RhiirA1_457779 [Rhizophagus irregularis]